jgi:hypothetical protein
MKTPSDLGPITIQSHGTLGNCIHNQSALSTSLLSMFCIFALSPMYIYIIQCDGIAASCILMRCVGEESYTPLLVSSLRLTADRI